MINILNKFKFSLKPGIYSLAYHEICIKRPYHISHMSIFTSMENFRQHMKYISDHFEIIDIKQLREYINGKPINAPKFFITFDDGLKGNYDFAFPLLLEYKIPSIIFIITSLLYDPFPFQWNIALNYIISREGETELKKLLKDKGYKPNSENIRFWAIKNFSITVFNIIKSYFIEKYEKDLHNIFLSSDQIKKMQNSNRIDFGLHTAIHPVMSKLTIDEQYKEVSNSLKTFKNFFQEIPEAYAHPYGHKDYYNNDTKIVLNKILPQPLIFSAYGGFNKNPINIKDIKRICIHDISVKQLIKLLRKSCRHNH